MAGKIALVTGGGSGIGAATARVFGERGAHVIIADLNVESGAAVAGEIVAAGGEASVIGANLMLDEGVEALFDEIAGRFGRLDIAFNNVGYSWGSGFDDISAKQWERTFALTLKAPWQCIRREAPLMAANGGGCIVNTASMSGVRYASISNVAYSCAKAGVIHLTTYAANHFAAQNIRVNAVSPGLTLTPIIAARFPDLADQAAVTARDQLFKRATTPEEVAATVAWLCSDEAAMVTGENICVSGGSRVI